MGTHPIFESDFDCLTDILGFQTLKMPKGKKAKQGRRVAPPPSLIKKRKEAKESNPLFEKTPKSFGIGGDIQPKRDMTRFVKWPKYVRIQRQRAVLQKRLKVPPMVNQFSQCLDKQTAAAFFKLALKYKPESRAEKKARLTARASLSPTSTPRTAPLLASLSSPSTRTTTSAPMRSVATGVVKSCRNVPRLPPPSSSASASRSSPRSRVERASQLCTT